MPKIKLELNFSSPESSATPWPMREWRAVASAAWSRLAALAEGDAAAPARVSLMWTEEGRHRVKRAEAKDSERSRARVDETFASHTWASADYTWPALWLYVATSRTVPGVLRMYVMPDLDVFFARPDDGGEDSMSRWLAGTCADLASVSDVRFGEALPLPEPFTVIPMTAFEHCLAGDLSQYRVGEQPLPDWVWGKPPGSDPISQEPRFLRGYGWITILTRALCDRLGGVDRLAASEAFVEVKELPNGSVILQATERLHDYDAIRAEQVWSVVAPVLRPGTPRLDALNETLALVPAGQGPRPLPPSEQVGRLIVLRDARAAVPTD